MHYLHIAMLCNFYYDFCDFGLLHLEYVYCLEICLHIKFYCFVWVSILMKYVNIYVYICNIYVYI